MERLKDRYPDLFQFFAGYFNQDWKDLLPGRYARTTAGVLQQAFEEHNNVQLLELQRVFRNFLDETKSFDDQTLGKVLLREFGAYYYAPCNGSTYRNWLESIDKHLDETIADRMRLV